MHYVLYTSYKIDKNWGTHKYPLVYGLDWVFRVQGTLAIGIIATFATTNEMAEVERAIDLLSPGMQCGQRMQLDQSLQSTGG